MSRSRSLLKNRSRQRIRNSGWLDERLRRGLGGGIPCGRRALFQKASLRRSRRSRPSPLLRLALWKNSSPRHQVGFFNRLLGQAGDGHPADGILIPVGRRRGSVVQSEFPTVIPKEGSDVSVGFGGVVRPDG